VEIDAKIAAGYFSSNKKVTENDLKNTVGRGWDNMEADKKKEIVAKTWEEMEH